MEICNELIREREINYCLISRIIKSRYFEIARHYKGRISYDCTLLYKTLSFLIMAQSSIFTAKINGCREI